MLYNHLVIVIGPSGSGKDSLISGAKSILAEDPAFDFTTREITRPADAGSEQHISISEEEFQRRRSTGHYAICWHAHDTWYGIEQAIEDRLSEGKLVVFNGSRAAIEDARKRFPGVSVIYIEVPEEVLTDRLTSRGRETDLQVRERLARNARLRNIPDDVIVLSNTGPLQQTQDKFIDILRNILADNSENRIGNDHLNRAI